MIKQMSLFDQDFVVNNYEIWKPIQGYEGLYEVSNLGRVRSLNYKRTGKTKILKSRNNGCGYLTVVLCTNGKTENFYIHRIVAREFLPNPQNLSEVNHRNEITTDNRADNLEWCTADYNNNYGTRNRRVAEKLRGVYNTKKSKPIIAVDENGVEEWFPSAAEAERLYGFFQENICACCKGRIKTYKGRRWKYAIM